MNNINLIGRLTKDPEMKSTQTGVSVCNFTLAVDRKYKDKNGERETDFINCVAWRSTAEFIARFMTKGQRIGVTGSLQVSTYDDRDGQRQWKTEVVVESAYFADGKGDNNNTANNANYGYNTRSNANVGMFEETADETQLPFDL